MTPRRVLINAACILGGILIALTLSEGILRLLVPQWLSIVCRTNYGLMIHQPNARRRSPLGHDILINSLGMRDREHTPTPREGMFRILLLGDSFMEAAQFPFEESLPVLLEKHLREAGPSSVEVITAAVSGWGTGDQLTFLTREGVALKPNLIVVAMTLHNDMVDNLSQRFYTVVDGTLVPRPPSQAASHQNVMLSAKEFAASHFELYQLFRRPWRMNDRIRELQRLDHYLLDVISGTRTDEWERGLTLTQELFRRIHATGRGLRAESAIVLIPLSWQVSDERLTDFLSKYNRSRDGIDVQRPQEVMKEFGEAEGIDVIDLLPSLRKWRADNRKELFFDRDEHWNQYGQRVAARLVAEELRRRGLVGHQK